MTVRRLAIYGLALVVWLTFLVLAVALGFLREAVLASRFGEQAAHVIGTLILVAAVTAVMIPFVRRIRRFCSTADLWRIGILWTALTVAFEFLFFHFAVGVPWKTLVADYDILHGRVWVLVPTTLLFGPPVVGRIARR